LEISGKACAVANLKKNGAIGGLAAGKKGNMGKTGEAPLPPPKINPGRHKKKKKKRGWGTKTFRFCGETFGRKNEAKKTPEERQHDK